MTCKLQCKCLLVERSVVRGVGAGVQVGVSSFVALSKELWSSTQLFPDLCLVNSSEALND